MSHQIALTNQNLLMGNTQLKKKKKHIRKKSQKVASNKGGDLLLIKMIDDVE
jgi:hypothetical protein